mgnify:CR=1 FL=1
MLEHAADLERNGKPVPVAVRDSIKLARSQVDEQRGYLQKRENEKKLLTDEHEKTLSRYRELKAAEAEKAAERSS